MNLQADNPRVAQDLATALEGIAAQQQYPLPGTAADVAGTRLWFEEYTRLISQLAPVYEVHAHDQPLSDESLALTARIYRQSVRRTRILFVHGGGWVLGGLDSHDGICRWLCSQSGSEVIAIAYDLAPEQPFPRAVEQTLGGLRSALAQSAQDGLPLVVMGDSSGATLASLAILRAHRREVARISGFLAAYGAFEPQLDLPSHEQFANGPFLRRSEMRQYWDFFAGELREPDRRQLSPLGSDLAGFPATLCLAMQCDLLRDDSVAMHEKVLRDGGASRLEYWEGLAHGCLHFVDIVPSVTQAAQSILRFIRTCAEPTAGIRSSYGRTEA
jgi:acetyl esterase